MKKEIIVTTDGSHSIAIPEMGVTYHSTHGAVQESMHVFIASGLRFMTGKAKEPSPVSIFEMGFGTGLDALLTLIKAEKDHQPVYFETIEAFPLDVSITSQLNYCALLERPDFQPVFERLHNCEWNAVVEISPYFSIKKICTTLADYAPPANNFSVVYFDPFAPDIQPDLWTVVVFRKLYEQVQPGAVLTTYCSKSIVRRAMAEAGWKVEKIPGPPHKREIVRATKPAH
jgi:tRNA U34 5-methylaminomethyl-2-thiouridine-forming methyltransferase MnmC